MIVKQVIEEDFINYKKPSMFIAFPKCTFKCGLSECQNSALANSDNINIEVSKIINKYMNNHITSSIVCGGLEPFDSWDDLIDLVSQLRAQTEDDIVIYTGYNEEEIKSYISCLKKYSNIIVKFGRYIPNDTRHYDDVLGICLASNNQYARRITND